MGQVNRLKDFTRGQIDAALMKIGDDVNMSTEEGLRAYLRGDLVVQRPNQSWYERNGVIYLSVTSDGTTGPEWEKWYDPKGFKLSFEARFLLNSASFKPTRGITTHVGIIKGMWFEKADRITSKIHADAVSRMWSKPNAEIACLIRKKYSNAEIEEMGLTWITAMHEPIAGSGGRQDLLAMGRNDAGDPWLLAHWDKPGLEWRRGDGFAFAVSQVSA